MNSSYSNQNLYRCFTTSSAMSREFNLVVPIGYDPNTAYSLFFGWHGSTWTSSNFARAGGMDPYFSVEKFANPGTAHHQGIFIYPQGLSTRPSGFVTLWGLSGTGWDLRVNGYDVKFFDDIVTLVSKNMCVDSRHVFTFGQSYGGFFNQVLTCARPNVLRASATSEAGSVAPYVGASCASRIPHFQSQNIGDPTIGYSLGTEARAFWMDASRQGCNTSIYDAGQPAAACRRYTNCSVSESVWCEANVNTHAPYDLGLTNNAGVAAWNFFKEIMANDP